MVLSRFPTKNKVSQLSNQVSRSQASNLVIYLVCPACLTRSGSHDKLVVLVRSSLTTPSPMLTFLQFYHVEASGSFSTGSCRNLLSLVDTSSSSRSISWLKWIPANVLSFIWKLDLDRIAVTTNLIHRGIPNLPASCALCSAEPEDTNHLFIRCDFAKEVWVRVSWWVSYDFTGVSSIKELTNPPHNQRLSHIHAKTIILIVYSTLWILWTNRNKWIFQRRRVSINGIIEDIKSNSYLWATHRGSKIQGDWDIWCIDPMRGLQVCD
ncbi:hypothetical protein QVD17_41141 [Tagetes erecta]|uniref:Reverse transcriptase zinc-binding domain-containing protein n=1 Tax=Tagetes erecta TaxID=13708 RepID=A0AAD8NB47_TARER|nr:hypothetical protein QVD17_41141 [Tagetes erecta]